MRWRPAASAQARRRRRGRRPERGSRRGGRPAASAPRCPGGARRPRGRPARSRPKVPPLASEIEPQLAGPEADGLPLDRGAAEGRHLVEHPGDPRPQARRQVLARDGLGARRSRRRRRARRRGSASGRRTARGGVARAPPWGRGLVARTGYAAKHTAYSRSGSARPPAREPAEPRGATSAQRTFAPVALGLVEGLVRPQDERLGVAVVALRAGDPGADREGAAELAAVAARTRGSARRRAARPRRRSRPGGRRTPRRRTARRRRGAGARPPTRWPATRRRASSPAAVAEGVVVGLEVVDVDDQQGQAAPEAAGALRLALELPSRRSGGCGGP